MVDAVEHFFWGQWNGTVIELGALDGSPWTNSMTHEYELSFGWKRILIEGNPNYRQALLERNPNAFIVNAAICETQRTVHFATSPFVGGIVEFMALSFLMRFHGEIYEAGTPPGNITSTKWDTVLQYAKPIECIPLSHVLAKAHVSHINYLILDVEVRTKILITIFLLIRL